MQRSFQLRVSSNFVVFRNDHDHNDDHSEHYYDDRRDRSSGRGASE